MDAPDIAAWVPSFNLVAQMSHLFAAAAIVFGARLLFRWPLLWGFAAVLLWAALKEFLFDVWVELDTWTNCWLDFGVYMLGGALAVLAVLIREWKDDRDWQNARTYWPRYRP